MKLTASNSNISDTLSTTKITFVNGKIDNSLTIGDVSISPTQVNVGDVSITPTIVSTPSLMLGGTQFFGGLQGGIIDYQEFTANGTWNNPYYFSSNSSLSYSQGLTYKYYTQNLTVTAINEAELDSLFNTSNPAPIVTFGGTGIHTGPINWGDSGQVGAGGVVGTKPAYLPANNYSWMVEGYIFAPETGTYFFGCDGDDALDVFVNGVNVANWYDGHGFNGDWTGGLGQVSGSINLIANTYYTFRARMQEGGTSDGFQVGWKKPSDVSIELIPANVFFIQTGNASYTVNTSLSGYEQAFVMAWGGGGGSSSNNTIVRSGGGGACFIGSLNIKDLPSTVNVTVGNGGTLARTTTTALSTAGDGGNSVFNKIIAYGGGGGGSAGAGGGGGTLGVGGRPTGGAPLGASTSTYGGASSTTDGLGGSIFGGGGGAQGAAPGSSSIYGGGGGAAGTNINNGNSVFGGRGGIGNVGTFVLPSSPGGGGACSTAGGSQNGARGEVRVWVFGPGGSTVGLPTYILTSNTTLLNESASVLYTISTTNVANGTVLYYTLNNSSTAVSTDFTSTVNGSVNINGGTGTFTLTAADDIDISEENFTIDIRNNSETGSIVCSNSSVILTPKATQFTTVGATTYTVPTGVNTIYVKAWGSGGGAGVYSGGGAGGSGGFVKGQISVTPGETLNIFVPSGGSSGTLTYQGGGGGSWAGVFRGTTPLLIAGGGGGGGDGRQSSYFDGGAGGGTTAGNGDLGGFGGTQTAGGAGGDGDSGFGEPGSYLTGGIPQSNYGSGYGDNGAGAVLGVATYGRGGDLSSSLNDHGGGGGGGAGYYGGGGGGYGGNGDNSSGRGGGGGSSYTGGATNVTNTIGFVGNNGQATNPPNTSDIDYINGVGVGAAAASRIRGGSGLVSIRIIDR